MRVVLLFTSLLVLAAGAAGAAPANLSIAYPFTMSLTYHVTNPGKDSGATSKGIEGRGTISMRLTGGAAGLPPQALAKPSPYVVRYDIDAAGSYHGVMVVTGASKALGSLCLTGDVGFGKYDPSAGTGFPPTSGPFRSVGGTGLAARVSLGGTYAATKVAGSEGTLLKISFKGAVTVSAIPAKAPAKACLAVAKLGRR